MSDAETQTTDDAETESTPDADVEQPADEPTTPAETESSNADGNDEEK